MCKVYLVSNLGKVKCTVSGTLDVEETSNSSLAACGHSHIIAFPNFSDHSSVQKIQATMPKTPTIRIFKLDYLI